MRKVLFLISVVFFCVVFSQYKGGEEAREILRETARKAEMGDPESMYQMSIVYERGFDSIPQDIAKSDSMLRRAADAGHISAANMLAFRLMEGKGIPADTVEAVRLFEIAANAGDAKAQSNLGFLLVNGIGVSAQPEKGAYWLSLASEAGITRAQSMLGDLYRDGKGVAKDSLQAEAHYRAAFEHGLVDAGIKLAEIRIAKIDTLPDNEKLSEALYFYTHNAFSPALELLTALEDTPNNNVKAHACAVISDAYARQRGVTYNYEKSIDYLYKSAVLGNPSASFMLAELLDMLPDAVSSRVSDSDPEEYTSPHFWYEQAAAAGVLDAAEANRRLLYPASSMRSSYK